MRRLLGVKGLDRLIGRGDRENIPELENGTFGYCVDTEEFFMGTKQGNKKIESFEDLLEGFKMSLK